MTSKTIKSPLPGIFYVAPAPDKPAYKKEGDQVSTGDTIGLIEVMKSFHEVKSEHNGRISRFLVTNEEGVIAGQDLLEITDE